MVRELVQEAALTAPHVADDDILEDVLMSHHWRVDSTGSTKRTPHQRVLREGGGGVGGCGLPTPREGGGGSLLHKKIQV